MFLIKQFFGEVKGLWGKAHEPGARMAGTRNVDKKEEFLQNAGS